MIKINDLNIPAYQRKRSLAAKAKKKPSFEIAIKKRSKSRKVSKLLLNDLETEEISIKPKTKILPSDEIFSNPLDFEENKQYLREMETCGICEGYFDKIEVAIIKVSSPIHVGDKIIFEKEDGLFEQEVISMQLNRKDISLAKTGTDIGIKVLSAPKAGTKVYKII